MPETSVQTWLGCCPKSLWFRRRRSRSRWQDSVESAPARGHLTHAVGRDPGEGKLPGRCNLWAGTQPRKITQRKSKRSHTRRYGDGARPPSGPARHRLGTAELVPAGGHGAEGAQRQGEQLGVAAWPPPAQAARKGTLREAMRREAGRQWPMSYRDGASLAHSVTHSTKCHKKCARILSLYYQRQECKRLSAKWLNIFVLDTTQLQLNKDLRVNQENYVLIKT